MAKKDFPKEVCIPETGAMFIGDELYYNPEDEDFLQENVGLRVGIYQFVGEGVVEARLVRKDKKNG